MGVPKFFRYISERYPCLTEKLKEYQIPEFDNLYLDMNGIIHNCSHPNDADASFRITEETIFKNIFHYIEILFRIIQPQKLFFMAVDGVAPRAKINQQRGRRFRAAKEAEVQEAKARAKGQDIPKEARFDSNCITPGTEFMAKLNEQLKYFVTYKISTDKLWQKCKVILSGSEVPGEGEHKIMDYIRYMKAQHDYKGNTRHCLYGLDADLIMLGLCSHEPHFSLLREEVKFGKTQKKIVTPEEQNFCLLHLSLMREYLELEFSSVKDKLPFQFDIEKIIDDWILMGFLVGNDFIPHLPNLHIENGALPILYSAYMEVLPMLDGYINEAGTLNLERFEKFMEKLSQFDMDQFDEYYLDLKYFEGKSSKLSNEKSNLGNPDLGPKKALKKEIASMVLEFSDEEDENEDSEEDMQLEFVQHKRDYYMSKMDYKTVDSNVLRSQSEGYIHAIQWNLHYYYDGCCSWSWYYPHHYAPYISDIKNFKDLKLKFEMGSPFLPFEQLLAVLPAASKQLLPKIYHQLLTQEESPIIEYYPVDFKTDLNGKRQDWEAVVLIPIIDEDKLLKAMKPYNDKLTQEEKKRNKHGPMSIYTYTEKSLGKYEAPNYFPSIINHANIQLIDRESLLVPRDKLVKGLCKGVLLSIYFHGFPTLQHIPHTAHLEQAKVKVFEQPSRRENMILTVMPQTPPTIHDVAIKILGKTVFVGWPHLREALVVSVSDVKKKISLVNMQTKHPIDGKVSFNVEDVDQKLIPYWALQAKGISENYHNKLGIQVGEINILVHARLITGRQYIFAPNGKMTLEKQWNEVAMPFAHQVILHDITVHNKDFIQYKSIADIFKPKSICFMLGHPHYGAMGEVSDPPIESKTNRIRVAMRVLTEPNLEKIQQQQIDPKSRYLPGNIAAQRLGISSHLISRVTGTIFIISDENIDPANAPKQNIGLNLKFSKKNEEVPDYTKKDANCQWLYSHKAIDLIRNYLDKFPKVFERLEKKISSTDIFSKKTLFPDNESEKLDELVDWLKEQKKSLGLVSRPCGVEEVEKETVEKIEKAIEEYINDAEQITKTIIMQVKPHLLFKPGLNTGFSPPDPKAYHRLFDRIVSVRESFTVPFGYKGTIIGCTKGENSLENMYEVVFDKAFPGGLTINGCSLDRGYRLSVTDFINITYGIRIENKNVNKSTPSPLCWRQPNNVSNSPELSNIRNSPKSSYFEGFSKNNQNSNYPPPANPGRNYKETPKPTDWRSPYGEWSRPLNPPFQSMQSNNYQQPLIKSNEQRSSKKAEPSEFESIWNELNAIQKPVQIVSKPNFPVPCTSQEPKILLRNSTDPPQDPSTFLKAILKIPDENTENKKPSSTNAGSANIAVGFLPTAKSTDTPPMVQQLFDHARQSELKHEEQTKYSSLLLSHFQKLGVGFPRYNYNQHPKNTTVCAQIVLPDTRFFHGEFCHTHAQAAENVAKKVYHELKLDNYQYGQAPGPIMNPHQPPFPMLQTWYNLRPPMPPVLPSAFPQPSNHQIPQIPMPKWRVQPNANACVPSSNMTTPQPAAKPNTNPCIPPPQNPGNLPPPVNWLQSTGNLPAKPKESGKLPSQVETAQKPAAFVPLQAQKKNRNLESKQMNTTLSFKKDTSTNKPDPKFKNNSKESHDRKGGNKMDEALQQSDSSQKAIKPGPRRSRIAANFSRKPTSK